jgi:hypothetical protein
MEQTVWLPEDYAVVGKTIKLRASSVNEWVDGWEVVEVYPTKRDDLEHVFEYQFHRDAKGLRRGD